MSPGIRGNVRHKNVVCHGETAHSGAVNKEFRHDAVMAMVLLEPTGIITGRNGSTAAKTSSSLFGVIRTGAHRRHLRHSRRSELHA